MKDSEGKEKINYVTVFERPGLQEFLEQISEFADLVLFTAGLEGLMLLHHFYFESFPLFFFSLIVFGHHTGYARPLVDKIDAENRFFLRLYRPSTVST